METLAAGGYTVAAGRAAGAYKFCLGRGSSMESEKFILDGSKILYHRERLNDWIAGKRIAPITIECAITTKCNYKCVFCSKKFQHIEEMATLDKDTIFSFLDDAAEIGVKAISFIGNGENTCSPWLKDAILHGKSNGLDIALGTNGYLLTPEMLEEILPCLTYIRFSICAGERKRYAEIHGTSEGAFDRVKSVIAEAVSIKRRRNLPVTIGLQMVLMPEFGDQILPLAHFGKKVGADYLVIKHCTDDEDGVIGVDYEKYEDLYDVLKEAETLSSESYQVTVKWSKIQEGKNRSYDKCLAAPFMIQMSGNGMLAVCGQLFSPKYKAFHLGNINEQRFKDIFQSDKYWEAMERCRTGKDGFNPQKDCPYLCLQHNTNCVLWKIKENDGTIPLLENIPNHVNFI